MTSVSVLIPTYNRSKQLANSLEMLARQTHPCEVWVLDLGGEEEVEALCDYQNVIYERLAPRGSAFAGINNAYNHAYERTRAEYIVLSAPEVLVPSGAVGRILEQHQEGFRSVPVVYWLSQAHTRAMSDLPWRENLDIFKTLPDFGATRGFMGLPNMRASEGRHHICFSGQTRAEWEELGFLPKTVEWNDDAWLLARENEAKRYPRLIDLEVYHQYHLPRGMEQSVRVARIAGL